MDLSDNELMELLPSMRHEELVSPAELRNFFKVKRKIKIASLAKTLGVTAQCITNWFSGNSQMPIARQRELIALRDRILKIEEATGKQWGMIGDE